MKRIMPAYPLFIKDPYFSIYATNTILSESDTMFWTTCKKELLGILKVDSKVYTFLNKKDDTISLKQESVRLETFKTIYVFKEDDFTFKVEFVSPLPLNDLNLLSCPVCYMNYEFISTTNHDIEVSLAMNEKWCYEEKSSGNKQIRGKVINYKNYQVSLFGLKRQYYLSQSNDEFSPDWGYYLLVGEKAFFIDEELLNKYINNEEFSINKELNNKYILAINKSKKGFIMLAHDDVIAINYFGEFLNDYFFKDDKNIFDAIKYTYTKHEIIEKKLEKEDKILKEKAMKISKSYYDICCAAYRQSIGAHKLVINSKNELLFLSKECCSNGCIATVDITYPAMPLFLLYNPTLVKAMTIPIFTFAATPVWKYNFAPHDVGKFPAVCGQLYGNELERTPYNDKKNDDVLETFFNFATFPNTQNIYEYKSQMPIEESANMILIMYAYYHYSKDIAYLNKNYTTLKKWYKYLKNNGLVPKNQLCTDDFAGHLDKNINLAIKASIAIKAFSKLASVLNDENIANESNCVAIKFADKISKISLKKGYLPLTYSKNDERFSLKYNLAFDKLFEFNLFNEQIYINECNIYKKHINDFGIPLDSRKDYTKSDWQMWVASFADVELRDIIIDKMCNFLGNSPDNWPFSDWYDSSTGKSHMFRNRAVQGGLFMLLLKK